MARGCDTAWRIEINSIQRFRNPGLAMIPEGVASGRPGLVIVAATIAMRYYLPVSPPEPANIPILP
jgi:hypothetical protein